MIYMLLVLIVLIGLVVALPNKSDAKAPERGLKIKKKEKTFAFTGQPTRSFKCNGKRYRYQVGKNSPFNSKK